MVKVNENFAKLPGSYLFAETARRKAAYLKSNPGKTLINMGIGDVTRPLFPSVIEAIHKATDEMAHVETFRGYPPEQGFDFLRELVSEHDFHKRGANIAPDEVFISDGAKSDCANIVDIFGLDNTVAVCDPVYPVYVDSNAMAGRAGDYVEGRWNKLIYMPCTKETNFTPALPAERADMIYLCFPNNPTGASITRDELKKWVDYANANQSVILYDAAYEAYIHSEGVPHTIYEIPGAETCAIEFHSFSKNAGFTGTRCAYTVVPKALVRGGVSLRDMWNRRQTTKYNGAPYIIQRGAAAVYTEQGQKEMRETIGYYMENAKTIREGLDAAGIPASGGIDSPYVWITLPDGLDSWSAFDLLLNEYGVATTPGVGFGACGEGYIRVTAFGGYDETKRAIGLIEKALK